MRRLSVAGRIEPAAGTGALVVFMGGPRCGCRPARQLACRDYTTNARRPTTANPYPALEELRSGHTLASVPRPM